MEMELALNPKYVGKRSGLNLLLAGLKFGIKNYN